MATKKKAVQEQPKEDVREVSLEEVLGALINAVNNQTSILMDIQKRLDPTDKKLKIN